MALYSARHLQTSRCGQYARSGSVENQPWCELHDKGALLGLHVSVLSRGAFYSPCKIWKMFCSSHVTPFQLAPARPPRRQAIGRADASLGCTRTVWSDNFGSIAIILHFQVTMSRKMVFHRLKNFLGRVAHRSPPALVGHGLAIGNLLRSEPSVSAIALVWPLDLENKARNHYIFHFGNVICHYYVSHIQVWHTKLQIPRAGYHPLGLEFAGL